MRSPQTSSPGRGIQPLRAAARIAATLTAFLAAGLDGRGAEPAGPERDLNQPLLVGTSEVFFPYQFRDFDGELKGFANDITAAVGQAMNLRFKHVVLANTETENALRSGRVDFIQFWTETDERRAWADFSVPIVAGIETVAVVRKDDQRIHRLADLDGKRVAIGQKGNLGWKYLTSEHPTAQPVLTETTPEFLQMLAAGRIDAAVMSRLTAASMIERYHLDNLKVLEDRIPGSRYDVRYCFTVRKGDALLLARLNEGLAILHRTGEYDRIYHEWFGRYEARTFSRLELVSYVAAALALALVAATWGYLRQRTLRRRIARQAAELAEQRSLLAAVHEKHPVATVILEISGPDTVTFVSANGEAARLFALVPANLPRPLAAVPLTAGHRAYFEAALARWRRDHAAAHWEERIESCSQVLETNLVPLGGVETGVSRLCVLSNDVTRRRVVEQEVAQSRRLRALGELVGGIAHEFNNLLTPIIMTTSFAREQPGLSAEQQSNFSMIDHAARRAAELTRRLLTFGRKADERAELVKISSAIENCFALLQPTVDRRIEWSTHCPPDLPPLLFNPTDLSQVVFNLVLNARDTLLEKLRAPTDGWTPRLRVSVSELPGSAHQPRIASSRPPPLAWQRITVEDNGRGIAPDIIERIFEPFFTTKEVGQGTGLGLATVWHLVTEAGGDIVVESIPDAGSKFHVFLPRWEVAAAPAEERNGAAAPPLRRSGGRVLLVEDEPLVARATVAVLQRAGYTVVHQPDGMAAWVEFEPKAAEFELVLADVNMPRMSGVDFVRLVRRTAFNGRIMMMTGRVADEERRVLHELRVDRVLNKPFTAAELMAAIELVHRGSHAANGGR